MNELLVSAAAREAPERAALVVRGGAETWSYGELAARVERALAHLDALLPADASRVAFTARGRADVVVAMLALLERGTPFVPVHPRLTAPEVARLLADAAPASWLDDAAIASLAGPAAARARPPAGPLSLGDPAAVLYTSGSTGRPKGAVLSRGAFVASASASAARLGFAEGERWLLAMPLAHAGGLSILTRCLAARRTVVLEERFEARAALAAIERAGVTRISVVPAMLRALLAEDRAGALARLSFVLVGGAAAPRSLLEECADRGVQAVTTYGLTEACSQVTTQAPRAPLRFEPGSGTPLAGAEIAIVGPSGERRARGEEGRILVRGPMLMTGYLSHAPLDGAWLDTGDVGALGEHGELHVFARRTDLLVTGGENVYPVEVEQALEACTGVRAALVFGLPDDTWGQIVCAALVLAEGASFDGARLARELGERLAPFKRPRRVCAVEELPVVTLGKLDRAGAPAKLGPLVRPLDAPAARSR